MLIIIAIIKLHTNYSKKIIKEKFMDEKTGEDMLKKILLVEHHLIFIESLSNIARHRKSIISLNLSLYLSLLRLA